MYITVLGFSDDENALQNSIWSSSTDQPCRFRPCFFKSGSSTGQARVLVRVGLPSNQTIHNNEERMKERHCLLKHETLASGAIIGVFPRQYRHIWHDSA